MSTRRHAEPLEVAITLRYGSTVIHETVNVGSPEGLETFTEQEVPEAARHGLTMIGRLMQRMLAARFPQATIRPVTEESKGRPERDST